MPYKYNCVFKHSRNVITHIVQRNFLKLKFTLNLNQILNIIFSILKVTTISLLFGFLLQLYETNKIYFYKIFVSIKNSIKSLIK